VAKPDHHTASVFSSSVPIPPTNNDMANKNEPLPICSGGSVCHYQILQGIKDNAITYVGYPPHEYKKGKTQIQNDGCSPTRICSHQTGAVESSYTNNPWFLPPQADANSPSHLLGISQGSGAFSQVWHSLTSHGSASMDLVVPPTTKSSLLAHQIYAVSPKIGNSKPESSSKKSL
jgi:hypothetical protein